jgi:hypothetical protein
LLVCALALLAWQVGRVKLEYGYGSPGTKDLIEYWTAGQLLRNGENPYDFDRLYELQVRAGSFHADPIVMYNPPWLLIWLYPLLLLPFPLFALVWLGLSGGLILVGAMLVWRSQIDAPIREQVGAAWLATAAFVPVILTLQMGQTSGLVFLGVAGFGYFSQRRQEVAAGMCLALTTIKPHVVYLLWIAVLWSIVAERRWKLMLGILLSILPALGLLTFFWPQSLLGYRELVTNPPHVFQTPTLGGILRLWVVPDASFVQYLPSLLGGTALLLYLVFRPTRLSWRTSLSPLLLLGVATASYGWAFDFVVLLVPYLEIVGWVTAPRTLTVRQRTAVLASLLAIAAGMTAQNILVQRMECYFWMPWALGLLYVFVRRARG